MIDRRGRNEATGEVFSITPHLKGTRMGDRAQRTQPKSNKKYVFAPFAAPSFISFRFRKEKKGENHSAKYDAGRFKGQSLLGDSADDTSNILYRPKTQETKQTYELLLEFIQEAIGGQAQSVLCGAADEILLLLKNDKLRDKDRKTEIEALLSTKVAEQRFAFLVNLGKKITDWTTDDKNGKGEDEIDETYGVNVEFDGSSDEDEVGVNEVREGDEDDLSEGEEAKMDYTIQENNLGKSNATDDFARSTKSLQAHTIDAFWLQRNLSKVYAEATDAKKKAGRSVGDLEERCR